MGVELKLMPFRDAFAQSVLALHQDRDLFGVIRKCPSLRVPPGFAVTTPDGNGAEVTQDPYGVPLRYTTAGELWAAVVPAHEHLLARAPLNRAVWAYLAQLPPETKIALYWS